MDAHQSYCLNFLALTRRWEKGSLGTMAAWVLYVLAITFTVTAAWLLRKLLARSSEPVDLKELSGIGFWVAIVATVLNYARCFRFYLGTADSTVERRKLLSDQPGRPAFAVTAFLGPAAIIVIVVLLGADST